MSVVTHKWMAKPLPAIFICMLFVVVSGKVKALPQQCLQQPNRTAPCPHLIYKKAALAVPRLNISAGQVLCVCASDFQDLLHKPTTKAEEMSQKFRLKRLSADVGLAQQALLSLLQ